MKWRNSKERELLASGGSRDQTLPNKNNPNPDLSDARTDRQPSMSPTSEPGSPVAMEKAPSSLTAADQFAMTGIKASEGKFPASDGIDKQPKAEKGFKMEFDDSRPNQQHIFNNFYEKVRDINNSMVFNSRANGGNNMSLYYDEYESRSDSDEEISVT